MSIKLKPNLAKRLMLSAVGMAVLYLPVQQSFAQLEEIVVTARRYEESITDAPLAVAVMDTGYLKDNRIDSVQDILELTPGATWGQFTKAQPNLTLRGVNGANFGNASLESTIQVVYDGVPVTKAFMLTLPVYDLDRVEIMRGPQGTTFGRNATLGLMHFVTARPSQETSGAIEGTVGDLNLFAVNGHYNTALSDTLSGRIAFNYQDTDGVMEDRNTGKALEASENTSVRVSLLYEPSDSFSAYLKAEVIKDDELPTVRRGSECVSPWLNTGARYNGYTDDCDPFTALQDDTREWSVDRDITLLTAEFVWNMGDIAVTSLSGYQDGDHLNIQDAFGTPFSIRDQIVSNVAEIWSTELRVDNFASGNRLRWLAGITYLEDSEHRIETNIGNPNRGNCGGLPCPPEWTLIQDGDASTESLGIFGEVTFDITDQLALSVGGRYSDESRSMDWHLSGFGNAGGLSGVGLGNGARYCNANTVAGRCGTAAAPMGFDAVVDDSWDNFSAKVSLSYAVNDNNNVYALYSEGFKAGGFQNDARHLQAFNLFIDSEEVQNIEVGWKGSYDRALFAITAFQMEQDSSQVGNQVAVGASGNANLISNAPGRDNKGIEFEGTFAITDNLTVGASVGFYDVEFAEGTQLGATFDGVTGAIVPSGEDIGGDRPANSPDNTAALWAAYEWALAGGSRIRLRGNWTHRSDVWGQNGTTNRDGLNIAGDAPMYLRAPLDKFGVDLSWTSADENLNVSLWGKNLDNKADQINFGPGIGSIFNRGQPGPLGNAVRSRPTGTSGRRQIGLTAAYRFGG